MILSLLLSLASAQSLDLGRFPERSCSRSQSRSDRGFPCDSYAFFEFAPASGAGMGAPCSGAAITGAKGETIAVTRASAGTCTKGSEAAISVGDVVKLGNNTPMVQNPSGSLLELQGWVAATNSAIRSEEWCNVAWTNSVTCTTDTTVAPDGTTTAETLNDTSGAAIQCATQVVAIATQSKYSGSAYVLAGTASVAVISLTGTGNSAGDCTTTASGLSSTLWRRIGCDSAAAYGAGLTAVTIKVCVDTAAATTGTLFAWGGQLESTATALGRTSYIPTAAAAAARVGDSVTATLPASPGNTGCVSLDLRPGESPFAGGVAGMYFGAGNARAIYFVGANALAFDGSLNPGVSAGLVVGTLKHYRSSWSTTNGWVVRNVTDSTQATSAFAAGTWAPTATLSILGVGVGFANASVARLMFDPSETRCQ